MNSSYFVYYLNKLSKNFLYFILLFCGINIETSLNLFSFFDYAAPSLLSIIIFISVRKFNIHYSNLILFALGLIHDVLLGVSIGTSSIFFLLIKYFTNYIEIKFIKNNHNNDWFYFTCVFMTSFLFIFLINICLNLTVPDFSPILFHIGVTLIVFPFIVMLLNFINFITNFVKNNP